jgi:hypothetical protein
MGTTATYALRYPASSDNVRPYEDIQDLANDCDAVFARKGIVKRGRRTTNVTATTTEAGVLRVDNIPILANYAYKIWTSPLFFVGSAAADVNAAILRTNTAGVATTASTQLHEVQIQTTNTTHPPIMGSIVVPYISAVAQTLSVLLTVARMSGGTGTAALNAGAVGNIELVIECMGLDPGDSGVVL